MPKLNQQQFDCLIKRVQEGDPGAAVELVQLYEPEIRRDIRLRLTDPRLRRTLDSTDICQSVFGNFFVRASLGQFDFDRPDQLLRLLSTMARNKVIDRHRREKARRSPEPESVNGFPQDRPTERSDPGESPSQIVAGKELLTLVHSRLTAEEKQIATLRQQGMTWSEIGEEMKASGEALRKRLMRACDQALTDLGLNDDS